MVHIQRGRAGGGGQVNKTPTVLVSGGSGTVRKVMAQRGSIRSL